MADFDTIYEEDDEEGPLNDNFVVNIPDPIIVRGAGNVTMWVLCLEIVYRSDHSFQHFVKFISFVVMVYLPVYQSLIFKKKSFWVTKSVSNLINFWSCLAIKTYTTSKCIIYKLPFMSHEIASDQLISPLERSTVV